MQATQFHQLLDAGFAVMARAGLVPGGRFPLAPVDPRVVARVLADAVERGPRGRLDPVCGPQVAPLDDYVRAWKRVPQRRCVAVALPLAPRVRRALMAGALVPSGAVAAGPTFDAWLRE